MVKYLTRQNSASVNFLISAALLIVLGVIMGSILTLEFVFPDLFAGVPWLVFGRLRQAHVNTVLFAWLSGGMMGLWFYFVPQLTGRRLWSELLGNICVILWNLAVIIGVVGILAGDTQSREYAEMMWPVDWMVFLVLILNAVNILMTVSHRVDTKLFVSLWYISATVLWFPMVYFIGNVMWNPPTGALTGINDTILNWFYGHNILGLWFTTGLLPIIYYVISRETHTPLYSHFLSLIAFWGIALFYTGVGAHHLLWAPIPHWLQTIAVAESIGMILPVVAFMLNIYLTMRGNWNRVVSSIPLRFIVTGFAAYVAVSYQGSHEALRSINLITHFTQYVPSHAHLSLLFFSASTIIGGAYYVIPRVYKVQIFSDILSNVQYSLYVIGFIFFFAGFIFAGLTQGTSWIHEGLPVWTVLPALRPFFQLRAVGGALVAVSFAVFAFNIIASIVQHKTAEQPDAIFPAPVPAAPAAD